MASSTIPKSLASDLNSLSASLANTNELLAPLITNDVSSDITNLDNLPCPGMGRYALAAGVSPTGSRVVVNCIILGTDSYKTLLVFVSSGTTSNQKIYYCTHNGSSWAGWVTVV